MFYRRIFLLGNTEKSMVLDVEVLEIIPGLWADESSQFDVGDVVLYVDGILVQAKLVVFLSYQSTSVSANSTRIQQFSRVFLFFSPPKAMWPRPWGDVWEDVLKAVHSEVKTFFCAFSRIQSHCFCSSSVASSHSDPPLCLRHGRLLLSLIDRCDPHSNIYYVSA